MNHIELILLCTYYVDVLLCIFCLLAWYVGALSLHVYSCRGFLYMFAWSVLGGYTASIIVLCVFLCGLYLLGLF